MKYPNDNEQAYYKNSFQGLVFENMENEKLYKTIPCIEYKTNGNSLKAKTNKKIIDVGLLFNDNQIKNIFIEPLINYDCFNIDLSIFMQYGNVAIKTQQIYDVVPASTIQNSCKKVNTNINDFYKSMENAMLQNMYIKDIHILLCKENNNIDLYNKLLQYKHNLNIQIQAKEQKEIEKEIQAKKEQKAKEQKEKEAIFKSKLDFLKGYGKNKTKIQVEKIYSTLSKEIFYKDFVTQKPIVKTKKDFILSCLSYGYKAIKTENETHYYGSKWNTKETKPKTKYTLEKYINSEGYTSTWDINKTEFDFAQFYENNN